MATQSSQASTTAALAEFVANTKYEDLPEAARNTARRLILDTVGVAIAGAADPMFHPIRAYAVEAAGRGEVPAPAPRQLDMAWAAFLVGAASHILDYDDVNSTLGGHTAAPLLPVAFTLGYTLRASGKAVIRAIALGAEIETRIGAAVNPPHYSVGWHPTSVLGALGAAAAASALLDLNTEQVRRALGIAASHASGTKANFGTSVKSMHVGMAARGGIESALLARAGATANDHILDEQYGGYCELYSPTTVRSRATDGLGERYLINSAGGVGYKLLPCCGSTQGSTWGVISLVEAHRFDPSRVRAIRTGVDRQRLPHTNRPVVRTGLEGKFSTQYCQAVAALRGGLGLVDFEDEIVSEPTRQALMKLVYPYVAPDAEEWPDAKESSIGSQGARVEIELVDGTVLKHFQPCPRGTDALPASDADLRTKFLDCAARGVSPETAVALADQLQALESVADVSGLVEQVWSGSAS